MLDHVSGYLMAFGAMAALARRAREGGSRHVRPVVELSETPARWRRPSVPPGTHPPEWPPRGA